MAGASGGGSGRPAGVGPNDRPGPFAVAVATRRRHALGSILAVVLLLAAGCSRGDAARTAAEHFIDAYYVEANLPKAREEAVGLARSKIDDQVKLLSGQSPSDPGQRPTIHYKLLQAQDEAARDRRGFVFELSIHLDGGEKLARRTLVTMRDEGGAWRVANFQELD